MRCARQKKRGRRPPRVCVTGGIACGKNLVGEALAARGAEVIDTDAVSHALLRNGQPLHCRVVAAFGRRILGPGGEIDRGALGRIVFADPAKRRRLERLVHPAVIRAVDRWLRARRRLAAVLVPLAYEVGWERAWDRVVCVAAPAPVQLARLRRRGLSEAEARARIAAQWPVEEKMRRADFVVFNSGGLASARKQAARILNSIRRYEET